MDATERFEALLASGKDSPLLRFSLGMQYQKAGDHGRAILHLREAVKQDPKYSAAWKLLGRSLAESGAADEARVVYREGIAAAEAHGDKQAAKEMAVFLKRLDRAAGTP